MKRSPFAVCALLAASAIWAEPPFWGTIFVDPDIITASDPTAFTGLTPAGQGQRVVFDRRVDNWITIDAFLFDATFDDGLTVEVQVNPEFGSQEAARSEAQTYAAAIGQLPSALRTDVRSIWIHQGVRPFAGGNQSVLIHTGQAARYVSDGILEETLVHEAAHTSLDATHASADGWRAAQAADGEFISIYARDFPDREDVAESFLLYLAWRFRRERVSESLVATIERTMPNRLEYFEGLALDLHPFADPPVLSDRATLVWDLPWAVVKCHALRGACRARSSLVR